jgi:hypothetical protein
LWTRNQPLRFDGNIPELRIVDNSSKIAIAWHPQCPPFRRTTCPAALVGIFVPRHQNATSESRCKTPSKASLHRLHYYIQKALEKESPPYSKRELILSNISR